MVYVLLYDYKSNVFLGGHFISVLMSCDRIEEYIFFNLIIWQIFMHFKLCWICSFNLISLSLVGNHNWLRGDATLQMVRSGMSIWNLKNWVFWLKHKGYYLHHHPSWYFHKDCSSYDKPFSIFFFIHENFNCICWQSLLSWIFSPMFQVLTKSFMKSFISFHTL